MNSDIHLVTTKKNFIISHLVTENYLVTMSVFSTITAEILIEPCQLDCLEEYILQKLQRVLQNRIFSNEYGYISEIIGIEEIKFKGLSFANHDGSMVYSVKFNAICENPKPGDRIYCPILYYDDIMFSFVGPMEIIIQNDHEYGTIHEHNDPHNTEQNQQKYAMVKVDQTLLDVSRNIIKVLAVLDNNNDNNNINNDNNAQQNNQQ